MHSHPLPKIALIWAQFAPYHVDRCEAVGRRLAGRAEVLAVELASASDAYPWEPSKNIDGVRKFTLFPDQKVEAISCCRRFVALFRVLCRCDVVFFGIGYNEIEVLALAWVLRLIGVRAILMTDSKYDDRNRSAAFEYAKSLLLLPFHAAIVSGRRTAEYVHFLGFRRREVLPGYDSVGGDRIRREAGAALLPGGLPFAERDFIFVGRFVHKKNPLRLIDAFALYLQRGGGVGRRLVLVGSGPLEGPMRERIAAHGIEAHVSFEGFLTSGEVARKLAESLALVLVSEVEQWGLVVNEALALGVPTIVSFNAGSRDVLVRNLVNGYVVESECVEAIARAMEAMAADEARWRGMVAASQQRAWLGDSDRMADAVEHLAMPGDAETAWRIKALRAELC